MLTSIALTLILSCAKPAPHPEPWVTSSCEGPDRVVRNTWGGEERRFTNACTVARCEGADFVRRTVEGATVERYSFSPSCMRASCESGDWVSRDANGRELQRAYGAMRCAPPAPPKHDLANDSLKFGLSMR